MSIYNDYNLDMTPGQLADTVLISQGETAWRILRFKLYAGGTSFVIPEDSTALLNGRKADGHGFSYSMTLDRANNTASIEVKEQMSAAAGPVICEVVVENSGDVIGSGNFVLMVEPSPLNGAVMSDSDMDAVNTAVQNIANAKTYMETAQYYAERAEATVTGTIDWNGRSGHVLPAAGDYDATMVDYDSNDSVKDVLDDLLADVAQNTSDIALKAPIASPTFTGTPTLTTTPSASDDSHKLADTAFVHDAIDAFKANFDTSMSSSSTNAVQNKAIKSALDGKAASGHTHNNATTAAAGFMSANDKTYVDQMRARAYTSYGPGSNLAAVGDNTRCIVFLRRGSYAMVTFTVKIEVQNENVPSNTALVEGLPKAYAISPRFVCSTPSGSSVVTCYITSAGKMQNSTPLTANSTYYGNITYCCNDAGDWYDFL